MRHIVAGQKTHVGGPHPEKKNKKIFACLRAISIIYYFWSCGALGSGAVRIIFLL